MDGNLWQLAGPRLGGGGGGGMLIHRNEKEAWDARADQPCSLTLWDGERHGLYLHQRYRTKNTILSLEAIMLPVQLKGISAIILFIVLKH